MSEHQVHFYRPDGTAVYDIGIKDARKDNYFYGVTSIIKMWPKSALDDWKIGQAIKRTVDLPLIENEPLESYVDRVNQSLWSDLEKTAESGSEIHEAIEKYLLTKEKPEDHHLLAICQQTFDWIDQNVKKVLALEKPMVSRKYGYAGRCDLIYLSFDDFLCVADFKSRSPKLGPRGKKIINWYETQPMQLVAYLTSYREQCLELYYRPSRLISIVIDRDEPDKPFVKVWSSKKAREAWRGFMACYDLICAYKNYRPKLEECMGDHPTAEQIFMKFDEEPLDTKAHEELALG